MKSYGICLSNNEYSEKFIFWPHWVFTALLEFSLAAMSEDYMLWVQDYISVASLGAKCGSSLIGFSSCSAQAP